MLCLSLKTEQSIIHDHIDLVEYRFDYLSDLNLKIQKDKPLIYTVRSKFDGGKYRGSEDERFKKIESLLQNDPDYFDIEYSSSKESIEDLFKTFPSQKFILSHHTIDSFPENLDELLKSMQKIPATYYKICCWCKTAIEALKLLHFQTRTQENVIVQGMGQFGYLTRILGPIYGNPITYCSDGENETAPGQVSYDELTNVYRHQMITAKTKIFGLIGNPIDKSVSHFIHNAVMKDISMDAVYVKIPLQKRELDSFINLSKELGFTGLSVTQPFKEAIMPYLDEIDPLAQKMGAVNTLIFKNKSLTGTNTDGLGALKAIKEKTTIKDKDVVIIGAGGAAKALGYTLNDQGANLTIVNRTQEKAKNLAKYLSCKWCGINSVSENYDILINTTPSDMPIDEQKILSRKLVMDLKNQLELNQFLQVAKAKKNKIISGHPMFLYQAIAQYKAWIDGYLNISETMQSFKFHVKRVYSRVK